MLIVGIDRYIAVNNAIFYHQLGKRKYLWRCALVSVPIAVLVTLASLLLAADSESVSICVVPVATAGLGYGLIALTVLITVATTITVYTMALVQARRLKKQHAGDQVGVKDGNYFQKSGHPLFRRAWAA